MPFRPVRSPSQEPLVRERREEERRAPAPSRLWTTGVLEEGVATGRLFVAAWRPRAGDERGLVVGRILDRSCSRALSVWIAPAGRTARALTEMVGELVTSPAVPTCVTFPDRLRGTRPGTLARLMRPLGFRRVERARLGLRLREYRERPRSAPIALREVRRQDRGELVRLFRRAYDHDVDALFGPAIDLARDAPEYIDREILRNPHWDRASSFLAVSEGRAVGAVLAQQADPVPLIADVMVMPERRHAGIGSTLLSACVQALRDEGRARAELTVTLSNPHGAYGFYLRRGFVVVTEASRRPTGLWVQKRFLEERGVRLLPEQRTPSLD